MDEQIKKIIHSILLGGLFLFPFIAFIVPGNMFFPFITGKNFFFRILVELLGALWLALIILDKQYRPRLSPLLYAVSATGIVLILATIFGANPYRSFWSNYERMEGLVGHLHLFAYFLLLISVFDTEKVWRRFFGAMSLAGVAMAIYGYMQYLGIEQISMQSGTRLDGTFGNATYLAIFMVFSVFILFYLAALERRMWRRFAIIALALFELPILFLTATRGAILGFLGGVVLWAGFAVWHGRRAVRFAALSVFSLVVLALAVFLIFKDTDYVAQHQTLSRFSGISLHEKTVESRLTIWSMAIAGFKERPILGWGPENFNQVFNKYYKPELWQQEPWFDRSHNVIFDWLSVGGIAGLAAYLSIFVAVLYILWRRAGADDNGPWRAITLSALFGAYFFHNFFVFDNLISYILFFSVLGYVHFVYVGENIQSKKNDSLSFAGVASEAAYPFVVTGIVIALALTMYFVNVKPLLANYALLDALQDISQQGTKVDLVLADFEKVFAYNTFGSGEAREQLSGYANNISRSNLPNADKGKVYAMALREFERQVAENPRDVRAYLMLSSLYSDVGHNNEALVTIEKALELSPKKQQIYFMLADIYMRTSDGEAAVKAMRTAYDLDPAYTDAAMGLAVTEIFAGRAMEADGILRIAFGGVIVADHKLLNAYAHVGNYARVRDIWLKFIEQEPNNFQYHVNLAATYLHTGERDKSVAELQAAIVLNPQFQKQGEYYIGEIKAGRNP